MFDDEYLKILVVRGKDGGRGRCKVGKVGKGGVRLGEQGDKFKVVTSHLELVPLVVAVGFALADPEPADTRGVVAVAETEAIMELVSSVTP